MAQGIWYWAGPMGVALIGYVIAYFGADGPSISIGELHGFGAALARATPLDYAGNGNHRRIARVLVEPALGSSS